jgi:NAD(P)-dependent dehydrogenase (short-subunit alcohol dehydrogenase family)
MPDGTAIVVGVGPGLGWALVRRFATAGLRVAMAARNRDKLQLLLDGVPLPDVRPYACDATDPTAVTGLFTAVENDLGVPDLVVFNAGAFASGGILEIQPADFERCWRVGCFGGFLVGQAAARAMVARGRGTIIFTGATASLRGSARFVNLASPKFGLRAVAQSMARELGPRGVHVAHVIIDGGIGTAREGQAPMLTPVGIAETYWQIHLQPRDSWTHELDLRPFAEKF